jgi:ADP-ribose pyrophosphatase YjhB (NUDIX family)
MSTSNSRQHLDWSLRLQAIAQTGLEFATSPYDVERYNQLREIAAEMTAAQFDLEPVHIRRFFAAETGYATPKVDVRGVVFRNDKLLLVRESCEAKWTLPGGWGDVGSSPAENAVREVLEESGFEVRAQKLLAVFDRSKHPHEPPFPFHIYKMFFLCELLGGTARLSSETDGVDFFSEDALPDLSISRTTPGQIHRMFEHHRNPNLPTDFDPMS